MSNKKITTLYIRSAVNDNNKVQQQEDLLRQYSDKHSYSNLRVYVDNGVGGNTLNRPAFNQLTADIDSEIVATVIVVDFSRISRNTAVAVDWIRNVRRNGVSLISVYEGRM